MIGSLVNFRWYFLYFFTQTYTIPCLVWDRLPKELKFFYNEEDKNKKKKRKSNTAPNLIKRKIKKDIDIDKLVQVNLKIFWLAKIFNLNAILNLNLIKIIAQGDDKDENDENEENEEENLKEKKSEKGSDEEENDLENADEEDIEEVYIFK